MALTRIFQKTVFQRLQNDVSFAQALMDEAATLFFNDELETARFILREIARVHEDDSFQL